MTFEAAVHAKAIALNKITLDMTAAAGSGHPSSAMSIGHLVTVLMYHAMRWNPRRPGDPASDRLVLSEGHAVPIIYAAFADLGGVFGMPGEERPMTLDDLTLLRAATSELDGHPNPMEGFPFFDAATGSLGQGLSVAAGLGLAAKRDKSDRRIYCIIGDGESREGQITEALDFIVDHGLTNVLPIFNCNGHGQAARVSPQQSPEVLVKKLEAIGFMVGVIDGHEPGAIRKSLEHYVEHIPAGRPMAVVARTVKGWGSATMQAGNWHGKPPAGDALKKAKQELDEKRIDLVKGVGVEAWGWEVQRGGSISSPDGAEDGPARFVEDGPARSMIDAPAFGEAMKRYDMMGIVQKGTWATRKAYGMALRVLGHDNPRIFCLDADVSNSTYAETFARDPQLADRFVECKIAEQNMFSVGAGLSAAGKVPFCSTFAKFVTRGYDQIEMAINSGANLKIVGSHCGVTLAADGPSQMGLPDVAWFRAWTTMKDHRSNPGCYLLQPADAYAAYALTMAMAEYEGVCYMRTMRNDTEFLYDDETIFNLGGFEVLTGGRDLLIIAAGYMVHEANKCLDALDKAGIDATLVDLYSIPFDAEKLLDLANANNGMILTLEDNYGGGIGSAVSDALTEDGGSFTLQQMFVRRIPKSARTPEEELKLCGLHHTDIIKTACSMLQVAEI